MAMAGVSPANYRGDAMTYALLLVPLVMYDLIRLRKVHPATAWGTAVLLIRHPLHAAIAYTDAWQRIAAWLTPPV